MALGPLYINGLRVPSKTTLKKYGFSGITEWLMIADSQNFVCAICEKLPSSGRLVVDHFHAKGYKKMEPKYKRMFVRGLLCAFCNRFYVAKGINIKKAKNVVLYLQAFEEKINATKT